MKRYRIVTYGCQVNRSDSERIASLLDSMGYKAADRDIDLAVINLCSIRQSAVDRAQSQLESFKSSGIKTVLTGCILDKDRKKAEGKADMILDIKDLPKWPAILGGDNIEATDYFKIKPKNENSFSSFIPIMTGCDNFCTYCVVPYTRGREQSRPFDEIMEEVRAAVSKGVKEIWLLGQNVNSYKDGSRNLSQLLKEIEKNPGDFWIRFLSSHPKDITNNLIETIKKSGKTTEYLNLPVQSGDDEILKRMNRPYSISEYKKSVTRIVKEIPETSLSTDIIIGFPGESRKAFDNTVLLFKEIGFDMAYISKYSPRPGTAAFNMKDDVSRQEKEERFKELTAVLEGTALKKNEKLIGKDVDVLVQKKIGNLLSGKTRGYKTVKFTGSNKLVGSFVKIKIEKALPWGLKGSIRKK